MRGEISGATQFINLIVVRVSRKVWILNECSQHLATRLQKRMTSNTIHTQSQSFHSQSTTRLRERKPYICKKRSKPSLRCSITSSEKRFVNTFPGKGGILTRVDSRSNTSRNHSKSLYRLRTDDCFSLNAGMLVYPRDNSQYSLSLFFFVCSIFNVLGIRFHSL